MSIIIWHSLKPWNYTVQCSIFPVPFKECNNTHAYNFWFAKDEAHMHFLVHCTYASYYRKYLNIWKNTEISTFDIQVFYLKYLNYHFKSDLLKHLKSQYN